MFRNHTYLDPCALERCKVGIHRLYLEIAFEICWTLDNKGWTRKNVIIRQNNFFILNIAFFCYKSFSQDFWDFDWHEGGLYDVSAGKIYSVF